MTAPDSDPRHRTAWTAVDLMEAVFPPPKWAVPGIIAEGVNLLVSQPKLGKSWLSLGLGVAVATGGRALGNIDVDGGEVLYLALEDVPRRLQHRLGIVLAGADAPDGLTFATSCPPLDEGGADRIAAWLEAHPNARLVVIDVLAKIRGNSVRANGNAYDADYRAMGLIKQLADAYGVAVVVVHHVRKGGSDDFLEQVSGTNGLAGAADAVLVMSRPRSSADGLLQITGRDVEEAEHALRFDSAAGMWTLIDGSPQDLSLTGASRDIMAAIREVGAWTPKDLSEHLGLKRDLVRQTLGRMVKRGQIDTDGSGTYFLPAAVTAVTAVTDAVDDHSRAGAVTTVTAVTDHLFGDAA